MIHDIILVVECKTERCRQHIVWHCPVRFLWHCLLYHVSWDTIVCDLCSLISVIRVHFQ
jgi:hypothetical protein